MVSIIVDGGVITTGGLLWLKGGNEGVEVMGTKSANVGNRGGAKSDLGGNIAWVMSSSSFA